jgi:uncharacterized protein YcaQ
VITLSRDEARQYLLGHLGLRRTVCSDAVALLDSLRSIQLDPLDAIGTNVDLVAMARVDGLVRGGVFAQVYPGHAFEHWAKERCLLPAGVFPYYRARAGATESRWWRHSERMSKLPPGVVEQVLAEIRERGPLTAAQMTDHGDVIPMDWGGWTGTAKARQMAIEVLWTRCDIVVCGRTGNTKLYDVPERALPSVVKLQPATGNGKSAAKTSRKRGRSSVFSAELTTAEFHRWAILERVEAAGLLSRAAGMTWSMLAEARDTGIVEEMIEAGEIEEVRIEGSARPYLAPAGFRRRTFPASDGRMRILAPLDPLLWDRGLVKQIFDFEYVWEVYKPAPMRRWGWYVCPLLQGDRLVGRLEGTVDRALRIRTLWREAAAPLDDAALDAALARHAANCGVSKVVRPKRVKMD